MYVSHFNSFLRGGASAAAQQLHRALLSNGVESRFQHLPGESLPNCGLDEQQQGEFYSTCWDEGGRFEKTVNAIKFRFHRERFKRSTRGAPSGAEIFTSPHGKPSTPWPPIGHPAAVAGDKARQIIHLHWIAKFIDFPSFFGSLSNEQPVVWTLHDMNAATGGCHFSRGCQRFRIGCGNCPQVRRTGHNDISYESFETKRKALEGINLHIVAPSRWLLNLAQSSPLLAGARSFSLIPYGMPTKTLYPMDKPFAREALGIPNDAFLLCFGAMNLDNQRKGAKLLVKALKTLENHAEVRCLVFGSGSLGQSADLPRMIEMGKVSDDRTRRLVYSAADAFVLPSTEDNLPLTGLEAMACGTPVIGFDAGGIPDYVVPGKTGLLASNGNAEHLGHRLQFAVANPGAMQVMGQQARQSITNQFESETQARRYIELYHQISGTANQPLRRAA